MRRATQAKSLKIAPQGISIHALLAESDASLWVCLRLALRFLSTLSLRRATYYQDKFSPPPDISIHALLAESDTILKVYGYGDNKFLSTLSLRRATLNRTSPLTSRAISIHALLAESDGFCDLEPIRNNISIHALLAESDKLIHMLNRPDGKFLSTLSLRRATVRRRRKLILIINFYPRSPCGERLQKAGKCNHNKDFYPRSPCGERLLVNTFF